MEKRRKPRLSLVQRLRRKIREQDATIRNLTLQLHGAEVEYARLLERQKLSYLYGTLGLLHREAFLEELRATQGGLAFRPKQTIALLLIDVDNLKFVNEKLLESEELGYMAGNEILKTTAVALRISTRTTDLIAHWQSGDEFIAMLNNLDVEVAHTESQAVADRIRSHLAQPRSEKSLLPRDFQMSVSIGIAVAADFPGISGEALAGKAEAAMKESRRRTRSIQPGQTG